MVQMLRDFYWGEQYNGALFLDGIAVLVKGFSGV